MVFYFDPLFSIPFAAIKFYPDEIEMFCFPLKAEIHAFQATKTLD
jgi:hypothetical protein